jgi:hypothetical protein
MSKAVKLTPEEELKLRLIQDQHRQARRKARLVGAVAGVLAAWFFAYIIFFSGSDEPPAGVVQGEIEVSGSRYGSFKVPLSGYTCRSGAYGKFRGVDLLPADGSWRVRIRQDQLQGDSVELSSEERRLHLSPASCRSFEIGLHSKDGRVDDRLAYDGTLKMECPLEPGTVRGFLTFKNCF